MQLAPKLLPFWYEPEYQTGAAPFVKFRLRPLKQQEMIDVEELYTETSQRAAQFKAAMTSIVACENLYDEAGEPIKWPERIDRAGKSAAELRTMIVQAGLRIIVEMNGGDWKKILEGLPKGVDDNNKQPAETDPGKT